MTDAPGATPDATPSTTDPRTVARALVSSPLPLPTTTRLALLVLVAGAGASFGTWWWLVLGQDNWPAAQLACLPAAGASPDAVLDGFTGCVSDVRLAQAAVVLCGPLALSALALVHRAARLRLELWWWRARPDDSSLTDRLTAVLDGSDEPRPALWVRGRRVGVQARASGTGRRPRIVADSNVFNLPDRQVEAMFRHELTHLRLRDVGRVRLADAAWWILLTAVVLPVGGALLLEPALLGTGLLVRMAVVLLAVRLTLCAVLRVREHDADLGADADARAPRGAAADHIGSDRPPSPRRRLLRAVGLASHPTSAARLDVLADPARSWGVSSFECLATGLAAGLLFTDLALLVAALMPTWTQLAYTVTGLLTGWMIAGVVTVAWWRAVAVGHRDGAGLRPARAGASLGLGLFAGSQLSGRAAGDWVRDTGTADGLATALSLADVPRTQVLALAAALVIGGSLFAVWTTSLARAARATVSGPRSAPLCTAVVLLSGLLIAVPLGSWFLFARLTAARAVPDIRWSVVDSPWWVTGLAVSVVGALVPFVRPVRYVGRRTRAAEAPGPRREGAVTAGRMRPVPVLALALSGVLVTAGAGWAAVGGRFTQSPTAQSAGLRSTPGSTPSTVAPGTGASSNPTAPAGSPEDSGDRTVPLDELPVLPPQQEQTDRFRSDPALVCRALTLGGTAVWTDPRSRRGTADLLGGVDDTVLRAAATVLLRDPSGPVDNQAVIASLLRCDLYFRYHR
ncbi:M48 family metalloprotease [Streptomyces sp. NPDC002306]